MRWEMARIIQVFPDMPTDGGSDAVDSPYNYKVRVLGWGDDFDKLVGEEEKRHPKEANPQMLGLKPKPAGKLVFFFIFCMKALSNQNISGQQIDELHPTKALRNMAKKIREQLDGS
jgi:hypothetical protein